MVIARTGQNLSAIYARQHDRSVGNVGKMKYRGFISYSKKDIKAAKELHRFLETYQIPRSLIPKGGKSRLGTFFRDDEELAASADLGQCLKDALLNSECLIILCSPHSAKSKWVNEEVEFFKQNVSSRKVFGLILSGTPNAEITGDSFASEEECFPPSFARLVGNSEPFAINRNGQSRKRAWLKLVAPILGVDFDDLWQREKRRNQQRLATLAVLSVLAISTALAGAGLLQFRRSIAEKASLAEAAAAQFEAGNYSVGLSLMTLASEDGFLSPPVKDAKVRLVRMALNMPVNAKYFHPGGPVTSIELSPDGTLMATGSYDGVQIAEVESGDVLWHLTNDDGLNFSGHAVASFSPDGSQIAAAGTTSDWISVWDFASQSLVWEAEEPSGAVRELYWCKDSSCVYRLAADGFWRFSAGEGRVEQKLIWPRPGVISSSFQTSSGNQVLFSATTGDIGVWNPGETDLFPIGDPFPYPIQQVIELSTGPTIVALPQQETGSSFFAPTGNVLGRAERSYGFEIPNYMVDQVVASRDESRVAGISVRGKAVVWDAATGLILLEHELEGNGFDAAFLEGNTLIVCQGDAADFNGWCTGYFDQTEPIDRFDEIRRFSLYENAEAVQSGKPLVLFGADLVRAENVVLAPDDPASRTTVAKMIKDGELNLGGALLSSVAISSDGQFAVIGTSNAGARVLVLRLDDMEIISDFHIWELTDFRSDATSAFVAAERGLVFLGLSNGKVLVIGLDNPMLLGVLGDDNELSARDIVYLSFEHETDQLVAGEAQGRNLVFDLAGIDVRMDLPEIRRFICENKLRGSAGTRYIGDSQSVDEAPSLLNPSADGALIEFVSNATNVCNR